MFQARTCVTAAWALAPLLLLVSTAREAPAQSEPAHKQVLVIYSTRRDARVVTIGERDLPRILDDGQPDRLDYYSEDFDRGRFPTPEYVDTFFDYLRRKYLGLKFDVVILANEIPLDIVQRAQREVFPNTPIVFFSSSGDVRPSNSTGVVNTLDLADTVALATQLQPDVRNVFVIGDADSGSPPYTTVARQQLQRFASRLKVTYLEGLTTPDLEQRLRTLPPHSIVYYLSVGHDGAGRVFHPLEYLDVVVAAANAPVYCWVDSAIDHGVVGGSLKEQQAQIDLLAQLALRVLRGERADNIPLVTSSLNVRQVDWRALRRWGISEGQVPPDTKVLFRQPTAFERYRPYIIGTLVLLVAQSVLLGGLLVQGVRRRRAEADARRSEAALRTSYERIHDLGGRLLGAQEAERARIARELHDDVGQQIALLAIDLEMLGRTSPDGLAGDALARANDLAKSVHDLSHRLHPARLRLVGLESSLKGLAREFGQSGVEVTFTREHVPATLPPDVALCLFRVGQEALRNAAKYSAAPAVRVHLQGDDGHLLLTVTDNGAGFDPAQAWDKGLGLISMRERVEAIGGTFTLRSAPGQGASVEVCVPVPILHSHEHESRVS
jgi:signal transduction histidine kinase